MATMKAVGFNSCGGPEVLETVILPKPTATGRDLLVKIKAVSINPIDCKQRSGTSSVGAGSFPRVVGWDASGIVEQIGNDVKHYKVGDEVYYAGSIIRTGCYSEYALVDERLAGIKPKSLSFIEAAALPLTSLTVWEAMFEELLISNDKKANEGKSIFIMAGAGGVGSIATQIAKNVLGLKVITTASRTESIEYCKKMGADHIIDHSKDIQKQLEEIGIKEVDYIFETNNTDKYLPLHAKIIKPFGRIVSIVRPTAPLPMEDFFVKRVSFSWELMFTRSIFGVEMEKQKEILDKVSALVDSKVLVHTAQTIYYSGSAENFRKAHEFQESSRAIGKIVLEANF